ncbi:trypsin-like peptidase domain-containing protein [Pseudonocardia spinosispora]|uniref:trypsin-like peptidase domain-containing protein n=1 Tax=Pseudonocardia spinosispora TaxID=103441 RepID=UPI000416A510|nr:trypsin-like peptidase domain-containing protein [Pseudonocardia spinosispora]
MAYDETPGRRDDAAEQLEQKAGVPAEDQRASAEREQFERQFAEKAAQTETSDKTAEVTPAEDKPSDAAPEADEKQASAETTAPVASEQTAGSEEKAAGESPEPTEGPTEPNPPTEPISTKRPDAPGDGSSPWARPDGQASPTAPVPTIPQQAVPTGAFAGQQPAAYPGTQPYPGGAPYPGVPAYPGAPAQQGAPAPGAPGQAPGQQPSSAPSTGSSTRRKLLVGGVVLALVAALIGGWLGGIVGYRYAASGGHLSVLDGPSPDADAGAAPEGVVEEVAQGTLPTVVQIRVTAGQQSGAGSGMVISPDGLILTNNHVVSMAAAGGDLKVLFQDGRVVPGKIVGRDKTSDIAVVQAQNVSGLKPITLGNSDSVQIGQTVMAIGSPLGLGGTVTTGIVSALNRAVSVGSDGDDPAPPDLPRRPLPRPNGGLPPLPGPAPENPDSLKLPISNDEVLNAIQTDAAINPGNSGGPLVDLEGNVVGINTAIASVAGDGGQGGSVGLGFSIPINQAKRIAAELQHTGHAMTASLGASVQTAGRLAPLAEQPGALVVGVEPNSPAAAAGLKPQDRIVKIDKRPIPGGSELVAAIRSHAPGDTVELVLSDGRTLRAVLAGKPDN